MSNIQIDQVIEKYVDIRQTKRDLVKTHEEALKPIDEQLEKIEAWLLGKMHETGVDSFKTPQGTAYKTMRTSCTVADQGVFKEFVFAPIIKLLENLGVTMNTSQLLAAPRWDLVDFRSLKSGVENFIEDNKQVPPGLNVTQTTTVNVRSK